MGNSRKSCRQGIVQSLVKIQVMEVGVNHCRHEGVAATGGVDHLIQRLQLAVQLAALLGGREADVLETAQTVLYLLTALWLLLLGISRVAGSTVAPSGSAWTGILGTFAFYLLTVRRFCFNPSGIVRIVPTVQVFSALSALVLLQGAVKAFYLPHLPVGRGLFFRGYLAFFFCTCLEAPQAVCLYLGGQYTLAQLAEGLALGVIGLIGLRCAALTVGDEQPEQPKSQEQPEAAEDLTR